MPDVAVLPRTAQEVSEVVKLANRLRIPVVPRAGGTGLVRRRGAAARRHPRRRQADEPDPRDRPRGPHGHRRAGHQHAQAQRGAQAPRRLLSRRPGVVPVLARRRADRHRRLVAARRALRPHARQRHLDGGRAADGRDRARSARAAGASCASPRPASRSSSCSPATRARWASAREATLELAPRPEVEFAAFFAFDDYMKAWETTGVLTKSGLATLAGVVLFDEWKIAYLRRDDEAYIPQPDSVKAVVAVAMYGTPRGGRAGVQGGHAARPQPRRAATSATRSRPATGPRATTATPRRCTAARTTARP